MNDVLAANETAIVPGPALATVVADPTKPVLTAA